MTDEGKPYKMCLNLSITGEVIPLFSDENADRTMFASSSRTPSPGEWLRNSFGAAFDFLDSVDYSAILHMDTMKLRHKDHRILTIHC